LDSDLIYFSATFLFFFLYFFVIFVVLLFLCWIWLISGSRMLVSFFWFFLIAFCRSFLAWNLCGVFSLFWFFFNFVCPNHTSLLFSKTQVKNLQKTNFNNSSTITYNSTLDMYTPYSQLMHYTSSQFLSENQVHWNSHFLLLIISCSKN